MAARTRFRMFLDVCDAGAIVSPFIDLSKRPESAENNDAPGVIMKDYMSLIFGRLVFGAGSDLLRLNAAPTNGNYFGSPLFFGRPKMANRDDMLREMRANTEALKDKRSELVRMHPNAFVLMHSGKVRGIYRTLEEAEAAGLKQYPNRMFSLHELTSRPRRIGAQARA